MRSYTVSYDAVGFLTGIRDGVDNVTYLESVQLDAEGRVTSLRSGDGVITTEPYDLVRGARRRASRGGDQGGPRALPAVPYHRRREDGGPLAFGTQRNRLVAVRTFFGWLAKRGVLAANPASELELPRSESRLPKHVLSPAEG